MGRVMNEEQAKDGDLFQLLNSMLLQAETLSGQPEPDLRSKIEALRTESQKVPETSTSGNISEAEVNDRLELMAAKLAKVQSMVAEVEADPDAKSFLQNSAPLWMPVITATADQRRAESSTTQEPRTAPCNGKN